MASDAAGPLARQALDLAKNALLVSLRFMNAAFARLHPFPVPVSYTHLDVYKRQVSTCVTPSLALPDPSVTEPRFTIKAIPVVLTPYTSSYTKFLPKLSLASTAV